MLTAPGRVAPRGRRIGLGTLWPVGVGVLVGVQMLRVDQLSTSWFVYWLVGVTAAAVLPLVSPSFGATRRHLTIAFFLCLQLAVGFNLVYRDASTPSGYNGIRITLVLLVAGAYAGIRLLEGGGRWVVQGPIVKRMLLFVAAGVVSCLNAADHTLGLYGVINLAALMFCGLVASDMFARRSAIPVVRRMMVVALVTQCAVLLAQRATGVVFDLTGEQLPAAWGTRYPGTLGYAPSIVSQFLAIALMFAQAEWYAARRDGRSVLGPAAVCLLGITCLLLSLTRSSWIACALGTVSLAVYWGRREPRGSMVRALAPLVAIVAVSAWLAWPDIDARLHADHEEAAEERWRLVLIATEMVKAHPVIGVGINNARDRLREFTPDWVSSRDWVYVVHNQYLLVASETGLIGLGLFLSALVAGMRATLAAVRSPDRLVSETGAILLASMVIMLWGMQGDFYAGTQMYVILWVVLGMATGLGELVRREATAERS